MKTGVGIVTTKWVMEQPMIFKRSIDQAHGLRGTFTPGFGVSISDAVQASCSAYPFFNRKVVRTDGGDDVELVDGGYCANNPTLYAIADAIMALKLPPENIRVVSIGVGVYPPPKLSWFNRTKWAQMLRSVQLLQRPSKSTLNQWTSSEIFCSSTFQPCASARRLSNPRWRPICLSTICAS